MTDRIVPSHKCRDNVASLDAKKPFYIPSDKRSKLLPCAAC